MINNIYNDILKSFCVVEGINSNNDLLTWIENENSKTKTILKPSAINNDSFWFYDESKSIIRNRDYSFFTIQGIQNDVISQPIIVQNEVGYLGLIGKRINGVLHFLMQAKIEPGNINNVQISPTIQATKSNFTQRHGGRAPHYLDYFKNVKKYFVVYDGNEPEQCSRFFKKYNRNVIIVLEDDEEIDVLDHFKWMTIGQIKFFANNYDNLVNMDTRTVLSCIPYDLATPIISTPLFKSIFGKDNSDLLLLETKKYIDKKQGTKLIRLDELKNWKLGNNELRCINQYPFCFKFFEIFIEGREVTHWMQPLAVANGKALFALAFFVLKGTMYFLIKQHKEVGCEFGFCFGPTIQLEAPFCTNDYGNTVEKDIFNAIENDTCLIKTTLSEEGGRFYHEENINVVCEIKNNLSYKEAKQLGYYIVTYKTIRKLIEKSHMVNIQLRNLLSLLASDYGKN